MYRMSLVLPVETENKFLNKTSKPYIDRGMSKGLKNKIKELPITRSGIKMNKIILDHDSIYKINIHRSILIKVVK